ncbi:MAG TPA: hypothetical protein PKZ84_09855 [Anaerolineae bacterium]|nr:hypothetical protein [Anaerolineae bacterium]HQI84907.1 hypothetical protein [Anaerolineae bacterium]
MQTASNKILTRPWRWIWLIFVIVFTYAGYSLVFDSRNPVQWLIQAPLLFEQRLWGIQIVGGLVAGYLHFKGLLWVWHTISPQDQTPLRFFGGLLGLLIVGVLFQFVYDEATSFYEHLLTDETVSLGVLTVVWYLTLITIVTYETVNAHIRLLFRRYKETA